MGITLRPNDPAHEVGVGIPTRPAIPEGMAGAFFLEGRKVKLGIVLTSNDPEAAWNAFRVGVFARPLAELKRFLAGRRPRVGDQRRHGAMNDDSVLPDTRNSV
jgi:hypothetical protein